LPFVNKNGNAPVNYNFDVFTSETVSFTIKDFTCLGSSRSYTVSCDVGAAGYISVSGTTISVDFTKRGTTAAT
jgi:hypothetical protein